MNGGKHLRFATIDVDSLPIPDEGHQEGSEYNGHYARLRQFRRHERGVPWVGIETWRGFAGR